MLQAIIASSLLKVLKFLAIATGIYIVYRYFANKKDEKTYMKDDEDTSNILAKGQAIALRAAMNPSGSLQLFDVDGTNKTAIMNIAREIKDLPAVVSSYNGRFGGSLLHHLEIELGAEDNQRFLALAGGSAAAVIPGANYDTLKTGVTPYNLVRTTKQANARSTPKKPGYFAHGNILKTFDANNIIGQSTGKTEYDAENDIIFIEAQMANKKKQLVKFWVAKSQIELIPPSEYTRRKATGEKFTLQQLDGIGSQPVPEIATRHAGTIIYGEDFQPTDKVRERARLGIPNMFLKVGDRVLVRFLTVDGFRRWVDTKDVLLFLPKTF
jgi:hypothetical protein